jgi:hypothetical protein
MAGSRLGQAVPHPKPTTWAGEFLAWGEGLAGRALARPRRLVTTCWRGAAELCSRGLRKAALLPWPRLFRPPLSEQSVRPAPARCLGWLWRLPRSAVRCCPQRDHPPQPLMPHRTRPLRMEPWFPEPRLPKRRRQTRFLARPPGLRMPRRPMMGRLRMVSHPATLQGWARVEQPGPLPRRLPLPPETRPGGRLRRVAGQLP